MPIFRFETKERRGLESLPGFLVVYLRTLRNCVVVYYKLLARDPYTPWPLYQQQDSEFIVLVLKNAHEHHLALVSYQILAGQRKRDKNPAETRLASNWRKIKVIATWS